MKGKKLSRIIDNVKHYNSIAISSSGALLSYILLTGKETNSWPIQLSSILCFFSIVIGFIVGIYTIGAWETFSRNKWRDRMYLFHASQLILFFGAALLLIAEYTKMFSY